MLTVRPLLPGGWAPLHRKRPGCVADDTPQLRSGTIGAVLTSWRSGAAPDGRGTRGPGCGISPAVTPRTATVMAVPRSCVPSPRSTVEQGVQYPDAITLPYNTQEIKHDDLAGCLGRS